MPGDQHTSEEKNELSGESNEVLPIDLEAAGKDHVSPSKENQSGDKLPPKNIVSPILPPLTEAMDVHHHTHAQPKKWKHYLFEFFMLFLAVFCGFLAEYQLEHVIENNREKQYMQSMVEDLQSDTIKMGNWLRTADNVLSRIDSSLIILTNKVINDSLAEQLHRHYGQALGLSAMIFTDRTSSQLKSSGSMRLVRSQIVSDAILNYWEAITAANQGGEKLEYYRIHGRELGFKILNRAPRYLKGNGIIKENTKPLMVTNDPELLAEYANYMSFIGEQIRRSHRQDMMNQHTRAVNLMHLIGKEYDV